MTSRLAAIVCLSGLAFSPSSPVLAQSAAARYLPAQTPASQAPAASAVTASAAPSEVRQPAPCSEPLIRAAAAKKMAPPLVGCPVAGTYKPLLQFFVIVPHVRKTDSAEPAGRILSQSPTAGAPLAKAGQLTFDVSTGVPASEKPAASAEAPATSATPEKPRDKPPASSASPVEPAVESPAASPSSEAELAEPSAESSASAPSLLTDGRVTFPAQPEWSGVSESSWWMLAIGALVLGCTIGVLMPRRMRRRGKSSKTLPRVTCEATFGPGRLVRRGPLVLGEKGGK